MHPRGSQLQTVTVRCGTERAPVHQRWLSSKEHHTAIGNLAWKSLLLRDVRANYGCDYRQGRSVAVAPDMNQLLLMIGSTAKQACVRSVLHHRLQYRDGVTAERCLCNGAASSDCLLLLMRSTVWLDTRTLINRRSTGACKSDCWVHANSGI
jgi:hypothetical protein